MALSLRPPPWEALALVASHLDPKSLAAASCVSKSWSLSMSSDHLWQPHFTARFPSLSHLALSSATTTPLPFRRLFALAHNAAARRRPPPPKPRLSLSDLLFAVSVSSAHADARPIACCVKHGRDLAEDPNGLFRFDLELDGQAAAVGAEEEVSVAWNVVVVGWKGVFTMMEGGGKLGMGPKVGGWFSEVLPAAGCCGSAVTGGIVADLKMGLRRSEGDRGRVEIERVSVGMMSVVTWRYLSLDDGLGYLQHFLAR